jgi:hypothetical protein
VVGLTSEKTKANIAGVVGVIGVVISLIIVLLFAFGDLWSRIFAADKVTFTTEGYLIITTLAIGISMAAMGIGAAVRIGKKGMKERIADFANPILKSKGKVSLREIASHVKMNAIIVERDYIKPMIQEGYFEDTRFESGWLTRDVAPCPYCNEPVKLTVKKCPNCGAKLNR